MFLNFWERVLIFLDYVPKIFWTMFLNFWERVLIFLDYVYEFFGNVLDFLGKSLDFSGLRWENHDVFHAFIAASFLLWLVWQLV